MSPLQPVLSIDAEHQPDAYVIRIEGELDLSGSPDLESALAGAEQSQADRIVVDLDGLSFIDASGLRALLEASHRSASNGSRLRLTRGRGEVARMLRMTQLDEALPFTAPVGPDGSRNGRESRALLVTRKIGESLSAELLRLQQEARLAQQRFNRYRARTYGPRLTDPVRLMRLERAFLMAENRLRSSNPAAPRMQGDQLAH